MKILTRKISLFAVLVVPMLVFSAFVKVEKVDAVAPAVQSVTQTTITTGGTNHNIDIPGVNTGDVLLALIGHDYNPTVTTPNGWTLLFHSPNNGWHSLAAYYRIAPSNASATTVDFVTSGGTNMAAQVYRITGGDAVSAGTTALFSSLTNQPDPPLLNPGWGTRDTLWIAMANQNWGSTITSAPTNYTDALTTNASTGSYMHSARRTLTASSEDPGPFTLSSSWESAANTIAISQSATAPTVTTSAASSVTSTTAVLNSSVNPNGASTTITYRYSTSNVGCSSLGSTASYGSIGSGTSNVSPNNTGISSLSPNTTYYFCASANNSVGTTYGNVLNFTTSAGVPTVTSPTSASITDNSATLGGNVTSTGGAALTARGVCYSLTATDSTPGFTTAGGSTPESGVTCVNHGSATTGVFTISATSLTPLSAYSYRAFARNSVGNAYSSVGSFTTSAAPTVTTSAASSVTGNSAVLNSIVNPNGASTNVSYLWGTSNLACSSLPNTLSGPTGLTGTSNISPNATALSDLSGNATYYFCIMATNAYGTNYGSVLSFTTPTGNPASYTLMPAGSVLGGGATDCYDDSGAPCPPVGNSATGASQTQMNVSWSATTGPAATSYNLVCVSGGSCSNTTITGATSTYPHTGRTCGTTYTYQVIAVNASGSSTASDEFSGATSTCANQPSVTTNSASGQTTTTAILNSTVNPNNSSTNITYRYQTSSTSTCNASTPSSTIAGPTGLTGGSNLSGATTQQSLGSLSAGTRYYFCATATNAFGTVYGAVSNFWTVPAAPTSPSAANAGNQQQMNLTWNQPSGATGYNIYACSGASCTPTLLTSIGSTNSYQHTGLTCGTLYRYQIAATNSAGEGAKTSIFSDSISSGSTVTCYVDNDSDTYAPSGASGTSMCGSCSSGYTSTQPTTSGSTGNIDCNDGNAEARPNNPNTCGVYTSSADYNCDGAVTLCNPNPTYCNGSTSSYYTFSACNTPVIYCPTANVVTGSAPCGTMTYTQDTGCGYPQAGCGGGLQCIFSGKLQSGIQTTCY